MYSVSDYSISHGRHVTRTSTTKGGEDIINSQSELDSLSNTDDKNRESESDTDSEAHHSEDHQSDEDVTSNSTTDSEMEYDEERCIDVINCDFPDVKISAGVSKLREEIRNASPAVRNEVFHLRKENKELRGQICKSRTMYNEFSRIQKKKILSFRETEKGLCDGQDYFKERLSAAMVESRQLRASRDDLQQALQDNFSLIQQKEQELEQVRGDHRKITEELDEVQRAMEDLRKLQVTTKGREEYKSIQDLRKELEMDQLRDSIRKLNEDYRSLQAPGSTRELQQSKTAHESGGEELKQLRIIIEKLASDHEKLREAVQGESSRSKEPAKPIGPAAESRIDNNKAKGSRSPSNHAAMRADVQVQQSSALDLVLSAIQKNIDRHVRIEASGREFIPGPRHRSTSETLRSMRRQMMLWRPFLTSRIPRSTPVQCQDQATGIADMLSLQSHGPPSLSTTASTWTPSATLFTT